MDLGLQNAKVLVTAASGGLGAATARQFSREGAQVVINSRSLDKLQATARAINEETGNPVFTHAADVTNPDAGAKLIRNAVSMMGGLDIIITNAGGTKAGTFNTLDYDDWRTATDLTLLSAVNLIKNAVPHLKQSERAAILAIVSFVAKEPLDNLTLSNAIRPAVVGLTKSLSFELGSAGVRVNSILPGWTSTERVDAIMANRANTNGTDPETERAKITHTIPIGRMGKPEEFANAAVFLCSPAAGFVNGVAMLVDGGSTKSTF